MSDPNDAKTGREYMATETGKNRGLANKTISPWELGRCVGRVYLSNWCDNPYPENSKEWIDWRDGFQTARNEA